MPAARQNPITHEPGCALAHRSRWRDATSLRVVPTVRRERPRIAALDAARAFGVVAMVVGHTLDALLALGIREEPGPVLVAYWKARGFTAPLFLLASGWAVTAAMGRSGARGLAVPRSRLARVLLLLALGYALRWPGWARDQLLAGDRGVWAHLLAFDALHTIAVSLLAATLVFALPWTEREKAGAFAVLAVLAVALGMAAPSPLVPDPASLGAPLAMAIAQAAGGSSPFPLFPWAAYFFAGCIVGIVGGTRRAPAMAALGCAMLLATGWTGVGLMPPGQPVLIAFRTGAVLVLMAALSALPSRFAALLAPLGRASLGVYVIHVPVVYGWSTHEGLVHRFGPRLSVAEAIGLGLLVLAGSFAMTHVLATALRAGRSAARAAWERRAWAAALVGSAVRSFIGAQ